MIVRESAYCPICQKQSVFERHYSFAGEMLYFCEKCGCCMSEKTMAYADWHHDQLSRTMRERMVNG